MSKHSMIVAAIAAVFTSTCAKRVPGPSGIAPGTPYISWVIMNGDRDNPNQEFVCQSAPRNECVVPASRPDAEVFSDVHFYYHGAGVETRYTGSIQIGFFRGAAAHQVQANITVKKTESITNQSVTGIVSATPGTYHIRVAAVATPVPGGKPVDVRDDIAVVVR